MSLTRYHLPALERMIVALMTQGSLTRARLADIAGVSPSLFNQLVAFLRQEDLLRRDGFTESTGGRPAELLALNATYGYIGGIVLNVGAVEVILTDLLGNKVGYTRYPGPTYGEPTSDAIAIAAQAMHDTLTTHNIPADRLLGVGMGVTGIVNPQSGQWISWQLQLPSQSSSILPATQLLTAKLGVPSFIEDIARARAYAEFRYGAAADCPHCLYLTAGDAIGSGIIVNGQLVRGSAGVCGEMGHLVVNPDGPLCGCGNKGCLTMVATLDRVLEQVRSNLRDGALSSLQMTMNGDQHTLDIPLLCDAAEQGDKLAFTALDQLGYFTGVAVAAVLNILAPQLVVIGGPIVACGDLVLQAIRRSVRLHALPYISSRTTIVWSTLHEEATAHGAALLMRDQILAEPVSALLRHSLADRTSLA